MRVSGSVKGDGQAAHNLCRSQLKGRGGQDAPCLGESSFRARRGGGSAGHATGQRSFWRERWTTSRLEGPLPPCVIRLIPLLDKEPGGCT
eukprot:6195647-Pleurochrysis_carterae.AAC.7